MAEDLKRILYRSYTALDGSEQEVETELNKILESSRRNNLRDGLTGALLYTAESFTQVIEGPGAELEATFERICCDLRHRRVQLLEITEVGERLFEGWSMALLGGEQPFQALIPLISPVGKPELRRESTRAVVQLMRACLPEFVELS